MKDDGGKAFPEIATDSEYQHETDTRYANTYSYGGMSLRSYFAAKALQGFCANPAVFAANGMCGWSLVNTNEKDLASYTLHIADAMIAELAKEPS